MRSPEGIHQPFMTSHKKKPRGASAKRTSNTTAPTEKRADSKKPTPKAGSLKAGRNLGFEEVPIDFSSVEAELAEDAAAATLGALPPRRQAFVIYYCSNGFRGAKAARDAGYSEHTARSIAHELLTFPDVQAAVQARMRLMHMGPEEVTARLSMIARADISEYISFHPDLGFLQLDLPRLKADGLGFLIKEIWDTSEGIRVKVHDSMAALDKIARIDGLLKEEVEHKGMLITVNAEDVTAAKAALAEWEKQRFGSDADTGGDDLHALVDESDRGTAEDRGAEMR
jgi:hypothetical protein